MPPTLLLVGGSDEVVPAGQQLLFAERARAAGNRVGALVFEGAAHGVGGVNSAAGRAAVLRFLREHLGRGASAPPPPRTPLLSRAASGLGLLLGAEPAAAAAAAAWSPDAAGIASGGGAGAQHVRRCEGVFGVDKLPSWAQYDAEVLDVVGDGWLLGTATAVLPRARRGSVLWVKKDE